VISKPLMIIIFVLEFHFNENKFQRRNKPV